MKEFELWDVLSESLPRKKGLFDESKKEKIVTIEIKAIDLAEALAEWWRRNQNLMARLGGTRSALKRMEARIPERVKRAERIFKTLEAAWRTSGKA